MNYATVSPKLELATRTAAVALLGTYAAGFLIVSLHHASFGIAQFDLIKPKLLAAGVLFFIFLAIPALASGRAFGLFGFSPTATPRPEAPSLFAGLFYLVASSFALALMTAVLFRDVPNRNYLLIVLGLIGCVVCVAMVKRRSPHWIFATALLLGSVALVFMVAKFGDPGIKVRTLWFLGVGLWIAWQHSHLPDVKRFESPWIELLVVQLIALAGLFAAVVYPKVQFGLGGGDPAPMTLQFNGTSPVGIGDRVKAWYIDETEKGYYILLNETDKKAVFLPRDRISAIYFGDVPAASPSAQPSKANK